VNGIKYISLAEVSGYGLSAIAYIRALHRAGVDVTWHPKVMRAGHYRQPDNIDQVLAALASLRDTSDLSDMYHAPVEYDTVIVHLTPEHWPAAIEPGKRMIGYTVWETDRTPLHWPALFTGYDRILTPSTFSRDVLASHDSVPVSVVPHLPRADWPVMDESSIAAFRRRFAIEHDDFMFYTINTWILRKAVWFALHAFLLAFSPNEKAVLLLKTNPHGEAEGRGWGPSRRLFEEVVANYPDPARVIFVPDELSEEDIGMLHLAGDAFVSLTRSEGFGMGAFDAATAGRPVIITGWGGQTEFLPPAHACLVNYELRQIDEHLGNHAPQEQYWAHADVDHAIEWMRRLYEDREEARRRGSALQAHVRRQYSVDAITRQLLRALSD